MRVFGSMWTIIQAVVKRLLGLEFIPKFLVDGFEFFEGEEIFSKRGLVGDDNCQKAETIQGSDGLAGGREQFHVPGVQKIAAFRVEGPVPVEEDSPVHALFFRKSGHFQRIRKCLAFGSHGVKKSYNVGMGAMEKLFSADGIRGRTDNGILSPESLERLGMALAVWWKESSASPDVLIGRDTRESGERIKQHLVKGLTRGGVKVVDAGIVTTPAISFLIIHTGFFCGGISISGSHLPVIENGIKIFNETGAKTNDVTELHLQELFHNHLPERTDFVPAPVIKTECIIDAYIDELIAEYPSLKLDKKIAIDYANGAASIVGRKTLSALSIKALSVNGSPNGTNINRRAGSEYARHSPKEFAREFRRYGCEIGIALDGDGDRVAFIDKDGKFFDGDMILAMLAHDLKQTDKLKNDTVVITQMSNTGLEHHLKKHGVDIKTVRNGDKYITDALLKDDLILGGEQVGHIIIRTNHKRITGDGLRTALWVLNELVTESAADISDLMDGLRKWPQVNTSVYLHKRTTLSASQISGLSDLLEKIKQQVPDLSRLECRPASTEPSYRVMLEAVETPIHILAELTRQVARHVQGELKSLGHPVEILDCVDGGHIHLSG